MHRQEKDRQRLDDHLSRVVEKYRPTCDVCGEEVLHEEGMFSMIGTEPRGPRAMGSLKCANCGRVMFFEHPTPPSE